MTVFRLSDDVAAAYPHARVALVTARGLRCGQPWPEVASALDDLERASAEGAFQPYDEEHPLIASWHEAYRGFGTNPRRMRPSVDALCRRLRRTGALPRINPAVDCYNLVSVRHGFPAGAFDLRRVAGDVAIRPARPEDTFVPLGEPDVLERPRDGEVVYADGQGVLTRHWNYRDAERTKVTEVATEVVFQIETVAAHEFGTAQEAAIDELVTRVRGYADDITVDLLHPGNRTASIAVTV